MTTNNTTITILINDKPVTLPTRARTMVTCTGFVADLTRAQARAMRLPGARSRKAYYYTVSPDGEVERWINGYGGPVARVHVIPEHVAAVLRGHRIASAQISAHGCDRYSVQAWDRAHNLVEDYSWQD